MILLVWGLIFVVFWLDFVVFEQNYRAFGTIDRPSLEHWTSAKVIDGWGTSDWLLEMHVCDCSLALQSSSLGELYFPPACLHTCSSALGRHELWDLKKRRREAGRKKREFNSNLEINFSWYSQNKRVKCRQFMLKELLLDRLIKACQEFAYIWNSDETGRSKRQITIKQIQTISRSNYP